MQENEKQRTYTRLVKPFSQKEDITFFLILFFFFNLNIWNLRALQSTCHEINVRMWEENICLKVLVSDV